VTGSIFERAPERRLGFRVALEAKESVAELKVKSRSL
jgi:hypothetical protein